MVAKLVSLLAIQRMVVVINLLLTLEACEGKKRKTESISL